MRYMLDTNICIYCIKQKPTQVFQRLQEHYPVEVCISSVTYAELVHSLWYAETLDEVHLVKLRMFVVFLFNCSEHFFYCLVIFRLIWETTLQVFQYFFCVHVFTNTVLKEFIIYLILSADISNGDRNFRTLLHDVFLQASEPLFFYFVCKVNNFTPNQQII